MNARGGSKIQWILGLAVTAALVYAAIVIIPIYIGSYALGDEVRNQAKFAGVERKSPEAVREDLFKKARELGLPIQREQIQVVPATEGVRITVRYQVPVDFKVYQTALSFDFQAETGKVN